MREKGIDERVRSEWKRKRGKEQIKEQETSKTMKKPEESSVRGKRSNGGLTLLFHVILKQIQTRVKQEHSYQLNNTKASTNKKKQRKIQNRLEKMEIRNQKIPEVCCSDFFSAKTNTSWQNSTNLVLVSRFSSFIAKMKHYMVFIE